MSAKREWLLRAESELRCEVTLAAVSTANAASEAGSFIVRLVEGNAEIFGIEMAPNKDYTFRDDSFAVFTWYGCKLETYGEIPSLYVSDKTPMVAYVNTHAQLEAKRDVALANLDQGPRVLIVGSVDQGKSTLARILASYAVRLDRCPIYVDLDCGQGAHSIPGTLSALPLDKACLTIEDPFAAASPLVYFYGHVNPADNIPLFQQQVATLATRVNDRMAKDVDVMSSGLIVNTCGHFESLGAEAMVAIIKTLQVDIVLVMGSDKVYSALSAALPHDAAVVVTLPRSGGVVNRDTKARNKARKAKINTYFYGRNTLSPERKVLRLSAVEIFQAGRVQLSEGMKFIGDKSDDKTTLVRVSPSLELMHNILAVVHPPGENFSLPVGSDELPPELLSSNAAGFVYVIEVSIEKDSLTVLMPTPGELPSHLLFRGSIKWFE